MATKKKDNKGPATQSTGTQGVNAVGVNHGMTRQEAVKPTPQQAMAQLSQHTPQPVQVVQQQVPTQTATNVQQNPVNQPVQTAPTANGYTYEQAAEGMKRFHGNVDLYHRPVVSSEAMNKAGYNIPSGNTATVYSMQRGIRDANGNVREILYTPISADGQVMSQRDIDAYIDSLDGSDDILAADRAGRNMIIHMDANPNGNDGQDLHLMQEAYGRGPQQQGGVQPVQQQQFALPQQITVGGKTIAFQPQQQPVQPQGQMPQQVTIGNNTYQMPTQTGTNAPVQQQQGPTAAQQNAAYEAQKQQEAEKEQYNQLVDEYRKAGGSPNAIRQHSDPNIERLQPTAEQVQQVKQAQDNAQKQSQTDEDEYVKTLKEYLDSKYESPEDKEAREKREARQRRFAAISEGLANVFNVGGSIAGARPAQWKSAVGDLYANQEAEADKQRLEYRQALKDMIDYRNAIRNGDIARARAIEEQRRNNFYEYKMLHDQENKAAEQELKKQKQEADQKRADQKAADQHRAANTKEEIDRQKLAGTYSASKNTPKKSSGKSGGGRGRNNKGKTPKQLKQEAINRGKAAAKGTAFQKKR